MIDSVILGWMCAATTKAGGAWDAEGEGRGEGVCVGWGAGARGAGQREVWGGAVAPSGMRCRTSYSLAVRVASRPFLLDLQCVCEQHLLRLASYASPCVGPWG